MSGVAEAVATVGDAADGTIEIDAHVPDVAEITYEGPDGAESIAVDAEHVSDSGRVRGVRIQRDDGSYLHIPDGRLYAITTTEAEGKVDYSTP
ncbi:MULTISPECIES: hypothetical protein [Halorussus]|uniref:hypothetical protein n=1 Tax=Halorussus TaxID=1070314 RepID=UPI0020A14F68|nr:hypothetical protein [Halorussus vallis]USZ75433.1 hypothetical protein NGM07_18615 [Halorussus vallis]